MGKGEFGQPFRSTHDGEPKHDRGLTLWRFSFVEFETAADLATAVDALDGKEFKEKVVRCVANVSFRSPVLSLRQSRPRPETRRDPRLISIQAQPDPPMRDRGRSRSPPGRRSYAPPGDDYDRRGPPRGYSPRRDGYRDGYRERSPPRREYYDDRARYRSPPRRGPVDDYPPPRGRYDDPYRRDYPPPDPYVNGRPYDRPPPRDFPPRDAGYAREGGYPREYDRPARYW